MAISLTERHSERLSLVEKAFTVFVLSLLFIPRICIGSELWEGAVNEPDNFRNIKWGSDLSEVSGLVLLRKEPPNDSVEVYRRDGDSLKIGDAELSGIEYQFWKGKFCGVLVRVSGLSNWEALKLASHEKFGPIGQPNPYIESYTLYSWKKIRGILQYEGVSQKGFLFISDNNLSAQMDEYSKNIAKKGAAEDF